MTSQYIKWPDYLVLLTFIIISLGIGLYHALTGGRQKTTTEFIMANRSLGVVPAAISLLVSFQSAIMMLGTSAEMYSYGIQYLLMANMAFITGPTLATIFVVPWMHSLKLVSVNEYLARRYQARCVRILGSCIAMTTGIIYMGTAMYAPSVALESATGFPITVSIPIMAIVSVAYTSMGGMRAVIWTDVFQFGIMVVGLAAVLIKGIVVVGGVGRVIELCSQEGRLVWADWNFDPTVRHTAWTFLIGWTVMQTNLYGLAQSSVQRYSATETVTKGRKVILLNIPGLVIMNTIACSTGLVVFAYFAATKCDPIVNKDIDTMNQLLPFFVTTMFASAPGFTGLFLATLYGGALSSVSSSLSGASANLWEDVLKWKLNWLSDYKQALLNRLLVVLFGFLATGMAFIASVLPGTILQVTISLNGSIGGPLCALFILGGFTKFANWKGAMIGAVVGLSFNLFLSIGSITVNQKHPTLPSLSLDGCLATENITDWMALSEHTTESIISSSNTWLASIAKQPEEELTGLSRFLSMSYSYYVTLGISVTFIVGSLASLILRNREAEEKMDERLLIPVMRRFLCSPERLRELAVQETKEENNNNDNSVKCANESGLTNSGHLLYITPLLVSDNGRGVPVSEHGRVVSQNR